MCIYIYISYLCTIILYYVIRGGDDGQRNATLANCDIWYYVYIYIYIYTHTHIYIYIYTCTLKDRPTVTPATVTACCLASLVTSINVSADFEASCGHSRSAYAQSAY